MIFIVRGLRSTQAMSIGQAKQHPVIVILSHMYRDQSLRYVHASMPAKTDLKARAPSLAFGARHFAECHAHLVCRGFRNQSRETMPRLPTRTRTSESLRHTSSLRDRSRHTRFEHSELYSQDSAITIWRPVRSTLRVLVPHALSLSALTSRVQIPSISSTIMAQPTGSARWPPHSVPSPRQS
ncbi:hypothetical protein GY45DRAFT_518619 [Cubamyces sp. BRFM 1775]|nr:hypothetical protein GY45DRAFT_518619 [Cubamyces sp. BRFM 1775]